MNMLIVGGGKGSWEIRGHQLGAALGARVTSGPEPSDWAWADVIVLVKRALTTWGAQARKTGRPVVWDALDFWMQPAENDLAPTDAVRLTRQMATLAHPAILVGATQAMARAVGGAYLPHHAWPGLAPLPARETVSVVAYQGNAAYLGRWAGWLTEACRRRGWRFQINPDDLREADILVAFRDGPWDGWICREWKSGVKLVNAMVAGRPVIGQASAAWAELDPAGTVIETPDALEAAFDAWSPSAPRQAVAEAGHAHAARFALDAIAARYRALVEEVACPA